MVEALACRRCRQPIPADAPSGECPACLLLLGLGETPDGTREGTLAVCVAAATVSASGFGSSDPDATATHSESTATRKEWPLIPGYEIVGELGEGGGGKVYKAQQLKADRRLVAIKVLHGTSKIERERILREARALGRISHPNIVTIYDVGETADGPYFSMEYMAGGTLADHINNNRPSPEESARIVEGVARGVAAAHAAGILHRDLKPSNVLLSPDGHPKVSDFGLAKFEEGPMDMTTLEHVTPMGALLGTPAYMAPEQAAGRTSEADERTDVYGIGAILYHCLTGRPPFRGETHVETAQRVVRDELVPPRSLSRIVHRGLEAVCLKCLEKKKDSRYRSTIELADEIARWRRGEPTAARPMRWSQRTGRRLRRNRRAIASMAIVAVLVAGTWAAMAAMNRPPEDEATKARRELAKALRGTEPVVLIGDTGLPKWSHWQDGAVPFCDSEYQDNVCAFQSLDTSRLELVPADLLPPAFVFEFEARHDGSPDRNSLVGAYFNDAEWEITEETRARVTYSVSWNDFRQPFHPKMNTDPSMKDIVCRALAARQKPGNYPGTSGHNLGSRRVYVPPDGHSRRFRHVRVVATPERIEVALIEDGNPMKFSAMPRDIGSMRTITDQMARKIYPDLEGVPNPNPLDWRPKGAVGLFVTKGIGSFRNVIITPLHNP